ncbi:wax ester synthase/diacylglycerol acyltransferase 11-like [Lycium barbarum]|uniref:wax ester synthase/diacylglycerol acyltransferase 11-like n=1 Tax=Lycium barbarum TaxID=112863 RepID=UPI00293EA1A3|nr:wax ester synthase/diacylglycerol acyltransferase 11-like [Lycium barbarum]
MESIRLLKPCLKPIATKLNLAIEEGEPLSPSARLFHEPNFNVHVLSIMGSKSRINPQAIKDGLAHAFIKHPRCSSLQVVDEKNNGEMKWVPTKVDVDKHVVVPHVDEQNLHESPEKFVENYIYNLSKTTLDKSKPLWDLHLLNIKTSDTEGVVILRMHHSLGDGTSLMSLFLACTRQTAHPDKLPTIPGIKKRDINSLCQYSTKGLWRYFAPIWCFMILFWNTVVDVLMFMATAMFLKDTNTPIKGRPGSEFNPRRFVHRTVSLDDMKLVKNALDMTINDVALGVIQAGLSVYLNRRFGEGKKDKGATEKNHNLPNNIRLRSSLLINLRPTAGIQALADMMDKNTEAKWGNMVGSVLLPFKIALRDDPLDYIREAKVTSYRKKNSLEAIYTFSISKLALKLFGIKTTSSISHRILTNTTLAFSNLVGPPEKVSLYEHPLIYLAPTSYGQPQALMINFTSYVNKMTMVLSVDESVIPDSHQLLDDLEQSLKLIKDAVVERSLCQE